MVQPLWFLIKLNIQLPYDPAIALLDIYAIEMKTYVHTKTCTQMFIAALFVIAKSWNQHRDPSTGECIPWNTTHIKKEQSIDIDNNLHESPGILLNEKSQPHKVIYCMIPFI